MSSPSREVVDSTGNRLVRQLVEFAEAVSGFTNEPACSRGGVERAAEALEAEIGVLVRGRSIVASVGFPPGQIPERELLEAAEGRTESIDIPGLGTYRTAVVALDGDTPSRLLLSRSGEDSFTHGEVDLLRGMARVLALNLRALQHEEERALREKAEREAAERQRIEEGRRESEERARRILDRALDAFVATDAEQRIIEWNPAAEATFGWSRAEALGRRLSDTIIPQRYREAHREGFKRFLATGEGRVVNTRLELPALHRQGHEFPTELTILPLPVGDSWVFYSFLRDITERKRADAELKQRANQQAAVAGLGRKALEGTELSELMSETARLLAQVLEVPYVTVLELGTGGRELIVRESVGWSQGFGRNAKVPVAEQSEPGLALSSGAPVVVEDWASELRIERPQVLEQHDVVSGMTVVIPGRDGPFGVLGAHAPERRDFSDDDINFVQAVANVLADAIEHQGIEHEMRHQAVHDPLTALPNRVLFLDRLRHAVALSKRAGSCLAVLFLDIDNFKAINDSLSHQAGDELLVALGPRLKDALRAADTLARFGGDEFVALCEDVDGERDAVAIAERITAGLARPFVVDGGEQFVTASIGIAIGSGAKQDPDALIRDADAAMYRSKERGRGRYELFDERMRARTLKRLRTESDLRRAIDRDELRVFYQPMVAPRAATLYGFEALLRWEHPERGLILPGEFIPVAEESGLIVPIGQWVLEEACRQTASWLAADPQRSGFRLNVNLSPRQLVEPDAADTISAALQSTGLEPASLALEITESVLMKETGASLNTLLALKELGVSLVLDDFGTGYSSLSYLHRFPIDQLKLDRSFVAGLDRNDGDPSIVAAVLSMAQALGIDVVAEGVETAEQATKLSALGCELVQGYYFGYPTPAKEAGRLLTTRAPRVASVT